MPQKASVLSHVVPVFGRENFFRAQRASLCPIHFLAPGMPSGAMGLSSWLAVSLILRRFGGGISVSHVVVVVVVVTASLAAVAADMQRSMLLCCK